MPEPAHCPLWANACWEYDNLINSAPFTLHWTGSSRFRLSLMATALAAAPGKLAFRSIQNGVACPPGAPYNRIMTTEEVKALPVEEKIRMMEAIWEDFRERFDRMEIPQEQKDLLDQRRARVREGKARLLDWDSVKGTIGRP